MKPLNFVMILGLTWSVRCAKQASLPDRPSFEHRGDNGRDRGGGPQIHFTPGDNSGIHASAPRSQKYWDAHGLNENKPDYAKTDAEVARERMSSWTSSFGNKVNEQTTSSSLVVRGVLAVLVAVLMASVITRGTCGRTNSAPISDRERELARQARLARFTAVTPATESANSFRGCMTEGSSRSAEMENMAGEGASATAVK